MTSAAAGTRKAPRHRPAAPVFWRTQEGVTRLVLNRPRSLNALDQETSNAFRRALRQVAREPSRVVVLTGSGEAFCAGGDLGFIERARRVPRERLPALMRRFYSSFLGLRDLPQATIAQVNGAAVGAGLCLAAACDLRTVLAGARLGFNFVRLGLNPGMAAWPLARAAFGEARARELLFTGRFFNGRQMAAWGAASFAAPGARRLEERTRALARELASLSGPALRLVKAETRVAADLEPFLAFEARGQAACFHGSDLAEGLAAVRERRRPRFA